MKLTTDSNHCSKTLK